MNIDIGIDVNKREAIAQGLSRVLADSYTLYLKTHNFHWNVTGPTIAVEVDNGFCGPDCRGRPALWHCRQAPVLRINSIDFQGYADTCSHTCPMHGTIPGRGPIRR